MMRRLVVLATLPVLLAGCASLDEINRRNRGILEPLGDGRFRYTVFDSTAHVIRGDQVYELWVYETLGENGLCGTGYDVIDRGSILLGDNLLDRTERRYFLLKCR